MLNAFIAAMLPILLVFGLYHLLTWFNILRINDRVYWKRIALASAIAHALLATGFFVFSYVDYQANRNFAALGMSYGAFLFDRSAFWWVMLVFDTLPMVAIVVLFTGLDRMGGSFPGVLPVTIAIVYVLGSLQWYFVGGGVGAILERLWSGLKTGDDEEDDPDWS